MKKSLDRIFKAGVIGGVALSAFLAFVLFCPGPRGAIALTTDEQQGARAVRAEEEAAQAGNDRQEQAAIRAAMLRELEAYLDQFKGTYFGKNIRIGDIDLFRKAADDRLRFIVGEEGRELIAIRRISECYHQSFWGGIMSCNMVFAFDPRSPSQDPSQRFVQRQRMMHEMTHHLEWIAGVKTDEKPRSERNCDYQDNVVNLLHKWVNVERQVLAPETDPDCVFGKWANLRETLQNFEAGGAAGGFKPDDNLRQLNGFHASFDEIKQTYLGGNQGKLKKLASFPDDFAAPSVEECDERQKKREKAKNVGKADFGPCTCYCCRSKNLKPHQSGSMPGYGEYQCGDCGYIGSCIMPYMGSADVCPKK